MSRSSGAGPCSGPSGAGSSWGSMSISEVRADSRATRKSRPMRLKSEVREGVPAGRSPVSLGNI